MANIFEFIGNPEDYRWDFPLKKNRKYNGDLVAHNDHTIEEILELNKPVDPRFKNDEISNDWKEVSNG